MDMFSFTDNTISEGMMQESTGMSGTPEEYSDRIASTESYWKNRCATASADWCSPNALRIFSNDTDHRVRLEVAKNHNTPGDVLASLATCDQDREVKAAAFQNPHLPLDTFQKVVSEDPTQAAFLQQLGLLTAEGSTDVKVMQVDLTGIDLDMQKALAGREDVADTTLLVLTDSPYPEVWEVLAKRTNVSEEVLSRLVAKGSRDLDLIILDRGKLPQPVFEELFIADDALVRGKTIENMEKQFAPEKKVTRRTTKSK